MENVLRGTWLSGMNVRLAMQEYKCLRAADVICILIACAVAWPAIRLLFIFHVFPFLF